MKFIKLNVNEFQWAEDGHDEGTWDIGGARKRLVRASFISL